MLLGVGTAVIVESTYGVSKHLPRDQREQRFIEKVRSILVRGGRVLLPVVALGRAQVLIIVFPLHLRCSVVVTGLKAVTFSVINITRQQCHTAAGIALMSRTSRLLRQQ